MGKEAETDLPPSRRFSYPSAARGVHVGILGHLKKFYFDVICHIPDQLVGADCRRSGMRDSNVRLGPSSGERTNAALNAVSALDQSARL